MSQHITGTQDKTYDLLSLLYHTLQGAEALARYIADAERGGDDELAAFFRETLESERDLAERGKALLRERLVRSAPAAGAAKRPRGSDEVEQASIDSFPASDAPANY